MLSGLKNIKSTGYPSKSGPLNIPWTLSITTTINEIQNTSRGQVTCQLFHLKFIWAKLKLPAQELQGIICLPKTMVKPPLKTQFQN